MFAASIDDGGGFEVKNGGELNDFVDHQVLQDFLSTTGNRSGFLGSRMRRQAPPPQLDGSRREDDHTSSRGQTLRQAEREHDVLPLSLDIDGRRFGLCTKLGVPLEIWLRSRSRLRA